METTETKKKRMQANECCDETLDEGEVARATERVTKKDSCDVEHEELRLLVVDRGNQENREPAAESHLQSNRDIKDL